MKIVLRILKTAAGILNRLAVRLDPKPATELQKEVQKWYKDDGDKSLRLNYKLNMDSLVFDLGGFEGQWTSDVFAMYGCRIHVFEPVETFAAKIENRFRLNPKISVHPFGLSSVNKTEKLSVMNESSSVYRKGDSTVNIKLIKATDFFAENKIAKIDLMKINIEGGEYDLLEHLISSGFVKNIVNIQVQFHDIVPGAKSRMSKIQNDLASTHELTYQYNFVWENWKRKPE